MNIKKLRKEIKELDYNDKNLLIKKIMELSEVYQLTSRDTQLYIELINKLKEISK